MQVKPSRAELQFKVNHIALLLKNAKMCRSWSCAYFMFYYFFNPTLSMQLSFVFTVVIDPVVPAKFNFCSAAYSNVEQIALYRRTNYNECATPKSFANFRYF